MVFLGDRRDRPVQVAAEDGVAIAGVVQVFLVELAAIGVVLLGLPAQLGADDLEDGRVEAVGLEHVDEAIEELRTGLGYSPDNPVLQGLWGYAAQSAAASPGSRSRAVELARGLRDYPRKSADGWYWLSVALAAVGEEAQAREALAEARRLAPELDPADYEARLRGVL